MSSKASARRPCIHYNRGHCNKGTECKFPHIYVGGNGLRSGHKSRSSYPQRLIYTHVQEALADVALGRFDKAHRLRREMTSRLKFLQKSLTDLDSSLRSANARNGGRRRKVESPNPNDPNYRSVVRGVYDVLGDDEDADEPDNVDVELDDVEPEEDNVVEPEDDDSKKKSKGRVKK